MEKSTEKKNFNHKDNKEPRKWVVIIEESLNEDENGEQHTAYVSCKPLSDDLPKSGSMGKNCYYVWDSVWDDYDEGMAHKNKLVEQLKPSQMVKKRKNKVETDKKREYRRLNNQFTPEEQAEYEAQQAAYLKEKYKDKDKYRKDRKSEVEE